tara:strand:+ start:131 stop:712 length:582 start_codon:yes stop_codon:yes gene_type:complete
LVLAPVAIADDDDSVKVAVSTAGPVEPVDPAAPAEPVDPVAPAAPAEPVEPVEPADPVAPAAPAEPVDPVDPVEPSEPVAPVEPVLPPCPCEPVEPVEPVMPLFTLDGDTSGERNQTEPSNLYLAPPKNATEPILGFGGKKVSVEPLRFTVSLEVETGREDEAGVSEPPLAGVSEPPPEGVAAGRAGVFPPPP